MTKIENFFAKLALAFTSKTVWSVFALIATEVPKIQDQIPPEYLPLVQILLALLAVYFRMNPNPKLEESLGALKERK